MNMDNIRGSGVSPIAEKSASSSDFGNNTKIQSTKKQSKKSKEAVKNRERLAKFDIPLFIIVLVLAVFGLVMLLSASFSFAAREHDDSYHYFSRQLQFMGAGFIIMLIASRVNYRIFLNPKIVIGIAAVSVVLMLMVKLTGSGVTQGDAERWLNIGGVTFQPSEILKFALILVLAYMVQVRPEAMKLFVRGFVPFCGVIGIACLLTLWQPHLSGTIILFLVGLIMLTVSPIRIQYIVIILVVVVLAAVIILPIMESMGFEYIQKRFASWRDPESDIQGDTFQTYQSLVTIGSGGWFGLGLGNSRQKFSYLPATHNDFIFSVICEELGFVGGALVLILFVIFILRGFYIASRARDRFGMMLAVGITSQMGVQALLNIAVVTNAVPNTGIYLPFFSYGGTAILVLMAQIGLLLSISRRAAIE
jgi:cell division protein FtsW